ncbi:pentapeptide repeat-containing protein [Arthrobacter sp. 1P04PC]|uniref:pentapeptide repeat-containing protein n=1 Tax=unclassified Arthrobacter TaxID=235627 RepID=UPI0039A1B70C
MKPGKPRITAPRLPDLRLDDLQEDADPDFRRGERYEGRAYRQAVADGLDLAGTDFVECSFAGVSFHETQLRGAGFRDCVLSDPNAPVLTAARAGLTEVEIRNPRWGSAELYEGRWQSVRIDGGKLDYVNLRGATLVDVQISDCIIGELDLGAAAATRVVLKDCTIGALDFTGARLKDVDLRGSEFRAVSGLGSVAGLVVDERQLDLLAPLLAAHLAITVA